MSLRVPQARNAAEALAILRAGLSVADVKRAADHMREHAIPGDVEIPVHPNSALGRVRGKVKKTRKSAVESFAVECGMLGLEPVREHMFAKEIGRKWCFDFAWLDCKVAVEIEGLVVRFTKRQTKGGRAYTVAEAGGRHATIEGFKEDCRKYATAALLGWTVLRFEQELVRSGEATKFTLQLLDARRPHGP
jgi:very-short-patch-repair endonuclease